MVDDVMTTGATLASRERCGTTAPHASVLGARAHATAVTMSGEGPLEPRCSPTGGSAAADRKRGEALNERRRTARAAIAPTGAAQRRATSVGAL